MRMKLNKYAFVKQLNTEHSIPPNKFNIQWLVYRQNYALNEKKKAQKQKQKKVYVKQRNTEPSLT